MMIVFFDVHLIVYRHQVPKGQTIKQHYYYEVIAQLRESVWKNDSNCERTSHVFSIKTTRWLTMHCLSTHFQPKTTSRFQNIRYIRLTQHHVTLNCSQDQICIKINRISVCFSCERNIGTLSNNGKIAWSFEKIVEGCMLKVMKTKHV